MDLTKIIELLSYTLPAVVTGLVALYFFKYHIGNEDKRRNFLLRKETQKHRGRKIFEEQRHVDVAQPGRVS